MSYSLAQPDVAWYEMLKARDRRKHDAYERQAEADGLIARADELRAEAAELLKEVASLNEAAALVENHDEADLTWPPIPAALLDGVGGGPQ